VYVCAQWSSILPSQQYQSSLKDPSYPVIAVHREHTHPEVSPPPLPAYPLRHVLHRARLAAVQYQQLTITNCCHVSCKSRSGTAGMGSANESHESAESAHLSCRYIRRDQTKLTRERAVVSNIQLQNTLLIGVSCDLMLIFH